MTKAKKQNKLSTRMILDKITIDCAAIVSYLLKTN